MSSNVTKTGQHGFGSVRPPKTSLGWKSSILVIRDRSEPDERRRFFSKLLCLARMSSNVTKTCQHGSGFPRPPKTSLGCKSSILVIRDRSEPDEWSHFFPKLLCLARMSSNVTKTGQHGSGSPRPPKTVLGCKSSILAIRDRSGRDDRRCFLSKLLCPARMSSNVTKTGQHGSGSPRAPKTSLGCKSSILLIRERSGPDERRRFFSQLLCLSRMSSNVTKTGQHGSGFLSLPKLNLVAKVQFWQLVTGPDLTNGGVFFPKLLCLAPMSSNVSQTDRHGSGAPRPPKTSLGCKSSILAIRDRSGPEERRRFFSKLLCLARMSSNVTKTGQHGSGSNRPPKTTLGCKSSILAIRNRSGPDDRRCFLSKLLCFA